MHYFNQRPIENLPLIKRMSAFAFILLNSIPIYSQTLPDNKNQSDTLHHTKVLKEVIVNGTGGKGRDKIGHMSISGAEINKRPALMGSYNLTTKKVDLLQLSGGWNSK